MIIANGFSRSVCYRKLKTGLGRFAGCTQAVDAFLRYYSSFSNELLFEIVYRFKTCLFIVFLTFTSGNSDFWVLLRVLWGNGVDDFLGDFVYVN